MASAFGPRDMPTRHVIVGGVAYPNSWATRQGSDFRLVVCRLCEDTGELRDDDGRVTEFCDCRTGMELAEAAVLAPVERAALLFDPGAA